MWKPVLFFGSLVGVTLSGLACSPEWTPASQEEFDESRARESLALEFPDQLPWLSNFRSGFGHAVAGWHALPEPTYATGLRIAVPVDTQNAVQMTTSDGFTLAVRDRGRRGAATLKQGLLVFPRENGAAVWVGRDGSAEDWLYFPNGTTSHEVARYAVEGGELRQHGRSIDVYDDEGRARVTISAPQVFASSGETIDARMVARRGEAIVVLDRIVDQPLLVDPVFVPAGNLNLDRMWHRSVLLNSGRVLIVGGYRQAGGIAHIKTTELFDPMTATFQVTGSLHDSKEFHTATLLDDGRVLAISYFSSLTDIAEVYDETTEAWTSVGPMIGPRGSHQAVKMADGRVLVFGGVWGPTLNTAEVFDPSANTWSAAGSMGYARGPGISALLGSGEVFTAGASIAAPTSSEAYSPVTNTWTPRAAMSSSHGYDAFIPLQDGRRLALVGGATYNITESYDEAADSWTLLANSAWRNRASSVILSTGRVMLTSGLDNNGILASSEMYDPTTGLWSVGPSLPGPRGAAPATLLFDGRVLIAGGYDGGSSLSTALFLSVDNPVGTPCLHDSVCASLHCVMGVCCDDVCAGACETCLAAEGAAADGVCGQAEGKACDDALACTTGDSCVLGTCSGAAVVCEPQGECVVPMCSEEADGACITSAAPDGAPCEGGSCLAGVCVGAGGGGGGGGGPSETTGTGGAGGSGAAPGVGAAASSANTGAGAGDGSGGWIDPGGTTGGAGDADSQLATGGCSTIARSPRWPRGAEGGSALLLALVLVRGAMRPRGRSDAPVGVEAPPQRRARGATHPRKLQGVA